MTEKKSYHDYAEITLKAFSLRAKDMGINSGYLFCAMDAYFNMLKLTLQTTPTSEMAETALSSFSPHMSIFYGEDKGLVIPCMGDVCYEPIYSPDSLREFFNES